MKRRVTVSIDGPTASGKTTLGASLAIARGLSFLDTGLSYRAAALAAYRAPAAFSTSTIDKIIQHLPARFETGSAGGRVVQRETILFDGEDVTESIWGPELDEGLKRVSSEPDRRAQILAMHEAAVEQTDGVVVVGRDVAVTLLPSAALHVYLTASQTVRRERRRAQYRDNPVRSTSVGPATARDIENRDSIRRLPRSIEIESTYLPAQAVYRRTAFELERNLA